MLFPGEGIRTGSPYCGQKGPAADVETQVRVVYHFDRVNVATDRSERFDPRDAARANQVAEAFQNPRRLGQFQGTATVGNAEGWALLTGQEYVKDVVRRKFGAALMQEVPDMARLLEHVTDWASKYAALRFRFTAGTPLNFPRHLIQGMYENWDWWRAQEAEQGLISRGIIHDANPEDDALLNLSGWFAADEDLLNRRKTKNKGSEDAPLAPNWRFFLTYKMSPAEMRYISKCPPPEEEEEEAAEETRETVC